MEPVSAVSACPFFKDVKKFYSENIPTKLKDFDVRKLEGKWYKVRGYNTKYDCYPCQTNTFKYNAETGKMETEVKLRVANLGPKLVLSDVFDAL